MTKQAWYYVEDGRVFGPVSLEVLCFGLRSGQIDATATWTPGMADWQPVPDAFSALDRSRMAQADSLGMWSMVLGCLAAASAIRPANVLGALTLPLAIIGLYLGVRASKVGSARGRAGAIISATVVIVDAVVMVLFLLVWIGGRLR